MYLINDHNQPITRSPGDAVFIFIDSLFDLKYISIQIFYSFCSFSMWSLTSKKKQKHLTPKSSLGQMTIKKCFFLYFIKFLFIILKEQIKHKRNILKHKMK